MCLKEEITLPPEFNLDFMNCLILEVQHIDFYSTKKLQNAQIQIQMLINYKQYSIEYRTQFSRVARHTIFNSLHVYKLQLQPNLGLLESTGELTYTDNILN